MSCTVLIMFLVYSSALSPTYTLFQPLYIISISPNNCAFNYAALWLGMPFFTIDCKLLRGRNHSLAFKGSMLTVCQVHNNICRKNKCPSEFLLISQDLCQDKFKILPWWIMLNILQPSAELYTSSFELPKHPMFAAS